MPHDIFVSYSRRDLAAVKTIKDELERPGFSCWMDLEGIESGTANFRAVLAPKIEESRCLLFFISPASLASKWTLKEIEHAEANGKQVVPIRFDDTPVKTGPVALELHGRDIVDWRIPEQREKLFRDLRNWCVKKPPLECPDATNAFADRHGKKIVPVAPSELFARLSFPEDLPRSLDVLRNLQTTEIHTGRYFDHSVDDCIGSRFPIAAPNTTTQQTPVSEEEISSGGPSLFLRDSAEVRSGLRKLEPSETERRSGFRTERFGDDVILVSDDVDKALRTAAPDTIRAEILPDGNPFIAAMENAASDPVRERIRAWWKRMRGDNFKNERKIGLASDVLFDSGTLPEFLHVFRTDYFSSYRTNELATKTVEEEEDGERDTIWEGANRFPWKTDSSGRRTMQPFSEPGFSNHLGGNTLGVTDDGMLVLWLQSGKAERSQGCWAPTGSGSLDWEDLDEGGSFLKTIANGAKRELKEEGLVRNGVDVETKVIGFYRWCSRGGLPGFLCVSRIGCEAADLSPNNSEVCTPKGRPLSPLHAARTPVELQRSVDKLLGGAVPGGHPLSIPLLANLNAIRKALAAGDPRLDFLFG